MQHLGTSRTCTSESFLSLAICCQRRITSSISPCGTVVRRTLMEMPMSRTKAQKSQGLVPLLDPRCLTRELFLRQDPWQSVFTTTPMEKILNVMFSPYCATWAVFLIFKACDSNHDSSTDMPFISNFSTSCNCRMCHNSTLHHGECSGPFPEALCPGLSVFAAPAPKWSQLHPTAPGHPQGCEEGCAGTHHPLGASPSADWGSPEPWPLLLKG